MSVPDIALSLARTVELAHSGGIQGALPTSDGIRSSYSKISEDLAPWERGRMLARYARAEWKLGSDPLSDETLSDLLELRPQDLELSGDVVHRLPIGLAVKQIDQGRMRFLFRRRNKPARRFEAARFLAEGITAPEGDRWLPETDAKTARQKIQRAFGAEFLCPIAALRQHLDDDFSYAAIEDAADHFGVSSLMVKSHLANNNLIPVESVAT